MLPLRARQDLRGAASIPPLPFGSSSIQAPVLDTQSIILAITSAVTAEIQKVEQRLDTQIRKAVAEAMIQSQYPIGRPRPAPHHFPVVPPLPHAIEDVLMDEVRDLPPVIPGPCVQNYPG